MTCADILLVRILQFRVEQRLSPQVILISPPRSSWAEACVGAVRSWAQVVAFRTAGGKP